MIASSSISPRESFLYFSCLENEKLRSVSGASALKTPEARSKQLGLGVSAVSNTPLNLAASSGYKLFDQAVTENPRSGKDIFRDPAMADRGRAFVAKISSVKTPLDSTLYALTLKIGADLANGKIDAHLIGQDISLATLKLDHFAAR
ncbi:hypothetical protein [Chromobacterium violaceum]|uniref:hypothetical protein n=1 Tax=Chromobacterium violaceum TaxID=536 RepID=UPI0005BE3782|nr:hypothetical protein [Chromobacterium violaceum]